MNIDDQHAVADADGDEGMADGRLAAAAGRPLEAPVAAVEDGEEPGHRAPARCPLRRSVRWYHHEASIGVRVKAMSRENIVQMKTVMPKE